MSIGSENDDHKGNSLLMRYGAAGFTFFLLKGLAWLFVPLAAAWLN